ncbi:T9SS type A sorting domain-containing protein [Reichenbachiella sp.]|uniref:T9SS type A sorting domain-containing protein n=1 Tax=Reichenbachiella sp. TaxID=2184521 RepID=UPI003297596C
MSYVKLRRKTALEKRDGADKYLEGFGSSGLEPEIPTSRQDKYACFGLSLAFLLAISMGQYELFAQSSIDEHTGDWTEPTSWVGGAVPGTLSAGTITANLLSNITINGSIATNANLSISQVTTFEVAQGDTLVVNGNLSLSLVTIYRINGVLTVLGDFNVDQSTIVEFGATANVVVTGNSDMGSIVSSNVVIGSQIYVYGTNSGANAFTNPGTQADLQNTNFGLFEFVEGGAMLPIELIHFSAIREIDHVSLIWETAVEINNSHFNIERSHDSKSWQTIAYLPGAGNSNALRSYEYLDHRPFPGVSYYRLKQTDFDGQYEYFEVISVSSDRNEISIFPNPVAEGNLKISGLIGTIDPNSSLIIYNSQGRYFLPKYFEANGIVKMDIDFLNNGVYWIRKPGGTGVLKFILRRE